MLTAALPFYKFWKSKASTVWRKRRFNKIIGLVPLPRGEAVRVLEVGCANGKDFLQFLPEDGFEIWGVDIKPCDPGERVNFVRADAAELPFPDGYFDLVVSVGLLEHIEPMEKLCEVIREFERVGRHQISVVPSIATLLEPHSCQAAFPLRLHKNMLSWQEGVALHLNFFTEHTWTKFKGFYGCDVKRFYYIFPFIRNTVVYK